MLGTAPRGGTTNEFSTPLRIYLTGCARAVSWTLKSKRQACKVGSDSGNVFRSFASLLVALLLPVWTINSGGLLRMSVTISALTSQARIVAPRKLTIGPRESFIVALHPEKDVCQCSIGRYFGSATKLQT